MGKFDGILICTDLDGTLLNKDKSISQANIDAIEYFKSEGGRFTIVTGRMPNYISYIVEAVHPNAPIGCVNGAGLYDWDAGDYVCKSKMPDSVIELVRLADESFSNLGIQVNTYYATYFCRENATMKHFRDVTGLPNTVREYTCIDEPIAKILFGVEDPGEIKKLSALLKGHKNADEFEFIRSEKYLYEIVPKGIGKGTAITNLCNYLGIDIKKTIAIGDYDNDVTMFETAHLAIAVSNASKKALESADLVTVSNFEDAIAKVIYDIDSGKITI